eukprot:SAG31_NODE_4566_length_3132_cov_1.770524_2_plen_45_part_00
MKYLSRRVELQEVVALTQLEGLEIELMHFLGLEQAQVDHNTNRK